MSTNLILNNKNANISMFLQFGNISWCSKIKNNGFGLYFHIKDENNKIIIDSQKILLTINIDMNTELNKNTDFIDIYDNKNELICSLKNYYNLNISTSIPIKSNMMNTIIKFVFIPIKSNLAIIKRIQNYFYSVENYSVNSIIPQLKNSSDVDEECSICLDNLYNNQNIYISSCNHSFHIKCIIDLLQFNKLFIELDSYCFINCNHTRKHKQFNCPICRR